jgi:hypothetical protein
MLGAMLTVTAIGDVPGCRATIKQAGLAFGAPSSQPIARRSLADAHPLGCGRNGPTRTLDPLDQQLDFPRFGGHGVSSGTALAVGGILATFVAQVAMGASWRIGVDPEVSGCVSSGSFGSTRSVNANTGAALRSG